MTQDEITAAALVGMLNEAGRLREENEELRTRKCPHDMARDFANSSDQWPDIPAT